MDRHSYLEPRRKPCRHTPAPLRSLRLRCSELRHRPVALSQLAAALGRIDGVCAVAASHLNGSVLIHYTAALREQFWNEIESTLAAHGVGEPRLPANRATQPVGQAQPSGAALARSVASGVLDGLIDNLVSRSAFALVAALL